MFIKEKQSTSFKTFSETEKYTKKYLFFFKKSFLAKFLVILGIGFCLYAIFHEPKNQEDRLTDLIARIDDGEELPSGEMKEYCHLMAILRDSISTSCLCILDGINWDNPPKNPEKLPNEWEEITHPEQAAKSNTRVFRHKIYTKIKISFDKARIPEKASKAFSETNHWHRFNSASRKPKEDYYLDKNCLPVGKGSHQSHILTLE